MPMIEVSVISSMFLIVAGLFQQGNPSAEVTCPKELAVVQTASVLEGWSVGVSGIEQRLTGVEVFYGSIEAGVQVVVPVWMEGNIQITQWQVADSEIEVWLRCCYRDTSITLDKRLDPTINNCTQRRGPNSIDVSCK